MWVLLPALAEACTTTAKDRYEYCATCCAPFAVGCLIQRGCLIHLRNMIIAFLLISLALLCSLLLCLKGCCKCSCVMQYLWHWMACPFRVTARCYKQLRYCKEAAFRDRLQHSHGQLAALRKEFQVYLFALQNSKFGKDPAIQTMLDGYRQLQYQFVREEDSL